MPTLPDCPIAFQRKCRQTTIIHFILISVSLTLSLLLVVGIIWHYLTRNEKRIIAANEAHQVELAEGISYAVFDNIVADTYIFAGLRMLSEHYEHPSTESHRLLIESFYEIAQHMVQYDQVRFINVDGEEIVRIQQDDGVMRVVPDSLLQNKADRYYVSETLKLDTGKVYVSPFDLNVDHGVIEDKPMLRFATPVVLSEGILQGVVVLNYRGELLKNYFRDNSSSTPGNLQLLNTDGYWLHSGNPEDEWGFMYDDRRDVSFAASYPDEWARFSNGPGEMVQIEAASGLFTFKRIFPLQNLSPQRTPQVQSYQWIIVSRVSQEELSQLLRWFLKPFIMLNVVVEFFLLAGAALLTYANARRRVANVLLEQAANSDPLTGLANRRHFAERFEIELTRYGRTQSPFAIILADIDHFKSINDTYGHNAGDAVLRDIAAIFRDSIRKIDVVGRWGGEEIILLLPETTLDQAVSVAEKLRIAVAERVFADMGRQCPVTVSFGVCDSVSGQTLETLVKAADSALYRSKKSGRNRVTAAPSY